MSYPRPCMVFCCALLLHWADRGSPDESALHCCTGGSHSKFLTMCTEGPCTYCRNSSRARQMQCYSFFGAASANTSPTRDKTEGCGGKFRLHPTFTGSKGTGVLHTQRIMCPAHSRTGLLLKETAAGQGVGVHVCCQSAASLGRPAAPRSRAGVALQSLHAAVRAQSPAVTLCPTLSKPSCC